MKSPTSRLLHHSYSFDFVSIWFVRCLGIVSNNFCLWIQVCTAQNSSTAGISLLQFSLSSSSSSSNIIWENIHDEFVEWIIGTHNFLLFLRLVQFATCPASPHCCLTLGTLLMSWQNLSIYGRPDLSLSYPYQPLPSSMGAVITLCLPKKGSLLSALRYI